MTIEEDMKNIENHTEIEEALEEAGDELSTYRDRRAQRHEKLQARHRSVLDQFLGEGPRYTAVLSTPPYYGALLVWAAYRAIESEGWQVERLLQYHEAEPVYFDIETSPEEMLNRVGDGQFLLSRGEERLILTINVLSRSMNTICAETQKLRQGTADYFVEEVNSVMQKENFYRGHILEFQGRLGFLKPETRDFEGVILDPEVKREIRDNTVGFLENGDTWRRFGIPVRRGVLLAGEPGTGKTILCKAILGEARGMTGILASAYHIDDNEYIRFLYSIARDLAPAIVVIEDIDILAQDRELFGYSRGPALLALLAEMDGITEQCGIVTVATTNHLETLDKALRQRPSRFDRVICLSLPDEAARRALIGKLTGRIPLAPDMQHYLARHTESTTPAQLQEMMYSLVIENRELITAEGLPEVTTDMLDGIIRRVRGTGNPRLGFITLDSEARREARAPYNQENKT